jgi:hypothetical protein
MKRYYAVLGLLASMWLVGQAHAWVDERSLELGQTLERLGAAAGSDTAIELNGQRLHLTSLSVERDVRSVLERFAATCDRHAIVLRRELEARAGAALCFAPAAPQRRLRYLFVREGHALLAWNERELDLRAMFPAHGDAAGSDIAGLPRPSDGVRVLSARVPGAAFASAAYRAPSVTLDAYAAELARAGFRIVHVAPALIAAVRGEEQALVQRSRNVIAITALQKEQPHVD